MSISYRCILNSHMGNTIWRQHHGNHQDQPQLSSTGKRYSQNIRLMLAPGDSSGFKTVLVTSSCVRVEWILTNTCNHKFNCYKLESIWCSHWIHAKLYAHLKSSSPFPSSSRILRGLILLSYRFSHSDKHNSHPATIRSSSFVKNAQALLRGATVNALYMINIGTST